jgi:hypothetical protein
MQLPLLQHPAQLLPLHPLEDSHWPSTQVSVPVQVWQVLPPVPHAVVDVAVMQVPSVSQQPSQLLLLQVAVPTQAPLVQVCPATQTAQLSPFEPHADC